jgi:hypothetical protein
MVAATADPPAMATSATKNVAPRRPSERPNRRADIAHQP